MTPWTRKQIWLTVFIVAGIVPRIGYAQESSIHEAPAGFAVVREHVIFNPRNIPPIRSELDYTIVEVDGAPVIRERPPPFVDIQPGALVSAGIHHFKARVQPHRLPLGYQPKDVSFVATVESGKVYFLVDDEHGMPELIAERIGPVMMEPFKVPPAGPLLPFLGFMALPSIDWGTHTIRCAMVSMVGPGSIADKAGLRPGDVIVAMNGRPVAGMQPLELTQFLQRKPPRGGTFDYQFLIERGIFKSRRTIAFTAANPGSSRAQSQTSGSQVDLESSDGGWGFELGDGVGFTLHRAINSFEMYKIWTGDPKLLLYRVTPAPPSETRNDDIVWRIPYHEPFEHAVPLFAKWSPPKPAEDAKTAEDLTEKFIANLSVR